MQQTTLKNIADQLNVLAENIKNQKPTASTCAETWGWNCPALTYEDIANISINMSEKIMTIKKEITNKRTLEALKKIPNNIQIFQTHTFPQLMNSNVSVAFPMYLSLINYIDNVIYTEIQANREIPWEEIQDKKMLPISLARRVRSNIALMDEIEPNVDELNEKINQINEAVEAAEQLPTDLADLRAKKKEMDKLATESADIHGKIDGIFEDSTRLLASVTNCNEEATKIVNQCEEAYRITTTKGLAGAFDQRAEKLASSMRIWVAGLVFALISGAGIGWYRVKVLSELISGTTPQWESVLLHMVLSVVSIGAPLWLAWISTKQIGQRFRLSEDYAFKASVAKAYEGYKKEAARIDAKFESRLFGSALSRLEEAPLRLVENHNHGSPIHEFSDSEKIKNFFNSFPEMKDKFFEVFKDMQVNAKTRKSKNFSETAETQE